MNQEFEIVTHNHISNFRLFLVSLQYRTPHIHRDFEICLVLSGTVHVLSRQESLTANEGAFFILNPYQPHELKTDTPATILSLQVSPNFFSDCYPQIHNLSMPFCLENRANSPAHQDVFQKMIHLAYVYYHKESNYELQCAGMVNLIFYQMLQLFPYRIDPDNTSVSMRNRNARLRAIAEYIDANYAQKLLLTDIAAKQELSLHYLSHFFKENFGVSFQQYVSKIRCEKAQQLLLLTDDSLLDISISTGFSDPKYFNRAFREQYGCTPKEYRKKFEHEPLPSQQKSMLTTQEFLSDAASLILLDSFYREKSKASSESIERVSP
ncbi:MAG: AraC family transcriptional regulator [Eubacterium sp.]|nr:AraC family transcriptional regulator [Eubacterium sp.]